MDWYKCKYLTSLEKKCKFEQDNTPPIHSINLTKILGFFSRGSLNEGEGKGEGITKQVISCIVDVSENWHKLYGK